MNKFEIIELGSPKWKNYIDSSFSYDFHHTPAFHQLERNEKDSPILFVAKNKNSFIAMPLIVKEISDSEFLDATSVYGYSGPFFSNEINQLPQDLIVFFQNRLLEYCSKNKVLSIFSRLHPLINHNQVLQNFGEIVELNKTISIDLTIPVEEQRRSYRKSLKSELNQLRRFGFSIHEANSVNEVDTFVSIYHSTMDKLGASEGYYFSSEYFHSFLKNKDFESKLLLAKYEGEIVAGAIFTFVGDIIQYHLAGTKQEYVKKAPMKLIIDEARLLGSSLKFKNLHLGGGVGGEDTDSLFRFKSGFSKKINQFSIWKLIVDSEKYNELVEKKGLTSSKSSYFPLYRSLDN